jgi:hypothetical protein
MRTVLPSIGESKRELNYSLAEGLAWKASFMMGKSWFFSKFCSLCKLKFSLPFQESLSEESASIYSAANARSSGENSRASRVVWILARWRRMLPSWFNHQRWSITGHD